MLRAQIGGLTSGDFDTAFADNASVMYLSLASLATLGLTAGGTTAKNRRSVGRAAVI